MIKIEVTGNSLPEVADKLLAIGHSLRNTAINEADNAARDLLQVQRNAAKLEVAEQTPSPLPSSGPTEAPPTTEPKASASLPTEASAPSAGPDQTTPPTSASDELNFDTDVAPYVLQVVKEKGKPVAQEILSQFGVEKASSLDPAQWPELVATLKGAL